MGVVILVEIGMTFPGLVLQRVALVVGRRF